MDEEQNRLLEIDQQVEKNQQKIREQTLKLFEIINEEEDKQSLEIELATLRKDRQILLDEKLNLERNKIIKKKLELEKEEADSENLSQESEEKAIHRKETFTKKQAKKERLNKPSVAIRLITILLVFAGIAFITISAINFAIKSLEPPPIEGLSDSSTENPTDNTTSNENLTLEQQALAIYLALNRNKIERSVSDDATPIIFQIETGETALTIGQKLQTQGLIEDAELFRRLLRYRGADTSLEAGVFELAANMTMDEILIVLQDGKLEETAFTFPEGWRATQMAELLEEKNLTSATDYMALVNQPSYFDYDFLRTLPANSTLEGYLFPDTYSVIALESNAESLIRLQLENFAKHVTEELRQTTREKQIRLHDAIILASIVEREAVRAEEREIIAGVYINRWQDGTVLNADPTIQYALGYQEGTAYWWKSPLTRQDLAIDSPYNTYTEVGLPPSPIANPGLDTIQAAILAPDTEFYYFVSRNNGSHIFAITFEEHLQNVAEYQPGQ
jgi:UPF0755 protein